MQMSIDRLRVEVTTEACEIPLDERARLQAALAALGDRVNDFPDPSLTVRVVFHPRSRMYNVEFKMKLPGRTLFTGAEDAYLDSALRRCADQMTREVDAYREHPDREAVAAAERRAALNGHLVAPEDPDDGPLGAAVEAGDYRAFRIAMGGYEEWLRLRVGRLIQRNPDAQARVGTDLRIGDVVEAVYLAAFERFGQRPTDVRLSQWLEGLIEPAIRELLRNPAAGHEAASLARTLRETPMR